VSVNRLSSGKYILYVLFLYIPWLVIHESSPHMISGISILGQEYKSQTACLE